MWWYIKFFLLLVFIIICLNFYTKYFYKYLPLLLLPLIFNACLYIITIVSADWVAFVSAHLTCEYDKDIMILRLAPESPNIPNALSLKIMQSSLKWLTTQYDIFSTIGGFCEKIKKFKDIISPWLIIFTSTLYFISWLSILKNYVNFPYV